MDNITESIREIVRDEIANLVVSPDPELLTPDEAAKFLGIGKAAVLSLVDVEGFPAVRLGSKTIRIDKRRLNAWIASGGVVKV